MHTTAVSRARRVKSLVRSTQCSEPNISHFKTSCVAISNISSKIPLIFPGLTINDQDVAPNEASMTLRELIRDLMRKGWNVRRFIKDGRRTIRRRALRSLWADGHLAVFDPKTGPTVDLF